ncbi:hypothetical protein Ancab_003769 [Ancistrocladus abbreviatus]
MFFFPTKRDRKGNRYGFARFIDVADEGSSLKNLETIWVESYKLRFDMAKSKNDAMSSKGSHKHNQMGSRFMDKEPFRSYKEALLSGHHGATLTQSSMKSHRLDQKPPTLEISMPKEEFAWLRDCFVGQTAEIEQLKPSSDEMDAEMLVKRTAMDSMSRIPCSSEEIYSARSEKEVHRSGDMHATSKVGGS